MKTKHLPLLLITAKDMKNRFNNKSLNGPAPLSKFFHIVPQQFKNIKQVYKHLKNGFDKASLIVDSIIKYDVDFKKPIALTKKNFDNKSQWLVLDMELSETLGKSKVYTSKIKTPKDVKNFVRGILKYKGSYILTSSSRWELKGKAGWHVYIPLTNPIDRTLLKKWLITKLNDSGNLWIGCSWKEDKPTLTQHKRSDVVDLIIYGAARKIYEAEQINPIDGRRKIIKFVKGNNTYLSTRSIHNRLNKYKKDIVYQISKEVKKQLKLNDKNGIKKFGNKQAWKTYNKQLKNGIFEPTQELYIQDSNGQRELKTVSEIVDEGKDIRYEALRSKPNSFDGAYYAETKTFVDYKDDRSFKMSTKHKHLKFEIRGKYIDPSVIADEDGTTYICSPTGTGKTHFIRSVEGTKLLLVPTKTLCENIHNPGEGVYYIQASRDTKRVEGAITRIKEGAVNVMTYDKFNSLMEMYEIDKTHKIYVDEIQNLLKPMMLKVASTLEEHLKHFNRVTFLSASLHKKYLPFIDRSYTFFFNRKLNISIIQNCDMKKRISKDGFHIIFNENKQQNIDTAKKLNALNVYSGNLEDIRESVIDTTKYKYLLATTVMSEGVSLYLDKPQTVYIHITKATDASLVIQMASRVRNAKKIKVIIYATKSMYSDVNVKQLQIDVDFMNSRLKLLKEIWKKKDSHNNHIPHYEMIMNKEANKYIKATDVETQTTSYFNLFAVTREYEKKLERHNLKYFKIAIRQFTKCKIKIKKDKNKTSVIERKSYEMFDDIQEVKECSKLEKEGFNALPMIQQKQILRYLEIDTLLKERTFVVDINVSDTQMLELTKSDKNLNKFKRHIKLLDNGVYDYLKDKRVFRHFKRFEKIAESRLIGLAKRLVNNAHFLKVAKLKYKNKVDIDYMEIIRGLIQIQPVLEKETDEKTYVITSYKLWGQ